MTDELEAMKERLRQITLQREAELRVAHEQTMEQLAEARTIEEARQNALREQQKLAQEKRINKEKAKQYAEEERQRELDLLRSAIESGLDEKKVRSDIEKQRQEDLSIRLANQEHAIELAVKALEDARIPKGDADTIMPNPLARFLMHSPK
jgi:hypothetical protein